MSPKPPSYSEHSHGAQQGALFWMASEGHGFCLYSIVPVAGIEPARL